MTTFRVYIDFVVSQAITVEADDYEEAINKAFEEGYDTPNITNKFEDGGDAWCSGVWNADADLLVYEGDGGP